MGFARYLEDKDYKTNGCGEVMIDLLKEEAEQYLEDGDIYKATQASTDTLESIDTLVTYASKITEDYRLIKERIDLVLPELDGQLNEANNIFEKSATILSKAQNSAEELGISINNIDGYNELEQTLNVLARYIDSVIRSKKNIENI